MDIWSVLMGVFGFLGKGIAVAAAFLVGKYISDQYKPKIKSYLIVIGMVGILGLVMWGTYGTHVEDADPLFGGGQTVTDFEPSSKERNEFALTIFFSLAIPAVYGVYKGKE